MRNAATEAIIDVAGSVVVCELVANPTDKPLRDKPPGLAGGLSPEVLFDRKNMPDSVLAPSVLDTVLEANVNFDLTSPKAALGETSLISSLTLRVFEAPVRFLLKPQQHAEDSPWRLTKLALLSSVHSVDSILVG